MDNYIERDYLQYRILEECESPNLTKEADEMLSTIYGLVINAPSCDVEHVIHAHWIEKEYVELKGTGLYAILGTCSNCNCEVITDESAEYCSNCGAVMDEEEPHEMCFDFEKTFHEVLTDEEVNNG